MLACDEKIETAQEPYAFMQAIRDAGIEPPSTILADGTLHRFHVAGDKAGSKNGWYVLLNNGVTAGAFGSWKLEISESWSSKEYTSLTPEERSRIAAQMERIRKQREAEQARMHAECRIKSKNLWANAHDVDINHPYLVAKGVKAVGIKQIKDLLVIPVRSYTGTLHGLQFIGPDGTKKFKTGTFPTGNFCRINGEMNEPLLICEGYATGASLNEATGYSVAVAFNAGNLLPVANMLRRKFPKRRIIICADDDNWTKGNPGITKATEAAMESRAFLATPRFNDIETKPTDFNDLHKMEGLAAVRRYIDDAVYLRCITSGEAALAKMNLQAN